MSVAIDIIARMAGSLRETNQNLGEGLLYLLTITKSRCYLFRDWYLGAVGAVVF
jgi:hypothetical protein